MDISRAELKYLVERQREEIKTLNEVGKLLGSTTNAEQMIRLTASYLHRTFPVALCGILLLAQRKLRLIPFAPFAQADQATAIRQIREAASQLLQRPISEEESAVVLDDTTGATTTPWLQPTTSLRSTVSAPLTVKGQPTGLLSLFSGQAKGFTKEDQHALGIVAEQLGAALRNALLVEELRHADELKNQMLSIVSHELSTPLTAIKEGVNLVLEGALGDTTPDQRDFLQTVNENTERLERLLEKVKTSTKIMTDQAQFSFESVDLRMSIAKVAKAYTSLAAARKVNLKVVDAPKPVFWQVDAPHLIAAISQLVENAIQATPADGFVTIKLTATVDEAEIQVLDTGSGIAKEALPTLFDRFKSLGEIHERKMGGLGLGLFIAKSLITGHGGIITVESAIGAGTRMTVKLPKQPPISTVAHAPAAGSDMPLPKPAIK
jgi:signal transduction histidine kinase